MIIHQVHRGMSAFRSFSFFQPNATTSQPQLTKALELAEWMNGRGKLALVEGACVKVGRLEKRSGRGRKRMNESTCCGNA